MTIAELEQIFTDQQAFRQLTESIRPGSTVQLASLVGSSLSLVAHGAIARLGGVHVLVAEDPGCGGLSLQRPLSAHGRRGVVFLSNGLQALDPVRTGGPVGPRTTHDGAQRTAKRGGQAADSVHISRGADRKSRRPGTAERQRTEAAPRGQSVDRFRRGSVAGMPFRTGRVRLRTGTILGSRRHRRHFLLFGQQTLSDRLFRRRDRLDSAVRRRHAALDRHARRGGDRSESQDGNLGRASRLAGPVRGRSHLLDRRRRLHAQALRRHPDEDSRRSGRAVVDRHAGHQPQRISLRREEGGFRAAARQRPRAARPKSASRSTRRPSPNSTRNSICWPTTSTRTV